MPLTDVEAVAVEQKDVPIYRKRVGTLEGGVNAAISAQVSGNLIRREYLGEPYMVTHERYDPNDMKVIADEFVIGRSRKWLSLAHLFRLPVPERRAAYVFGTAAEVMAMMGRLPSKAVLLRHRAKDEAAPAAPETDKLAAPYQAGQSQTPGFTPETK